MWKPSLPYHERSPERHLHSRIYGRMCLEVGVLFQVAAVCAGAYLWGRAGASPGPAFAALTVATVLAIWIDIGLFRELRSEDPGTAGGYLGWMWITGLVCLLIAGVIYASVLGRASSTGLQIFYLIPFFLLLVAEFMASTIATGAGVDGEKLWADGSRRRHFLIVFAGVALAPLLAAWLTASAAIEVEKANADSVRAWLDANPPHRPACQPWANGQVPIRVAVTLSGGGYRAAVAHAGVIAALDDQCVPIDYLSTVSGGSIIGTAYALGMPPREFANRLARRPPRLADDLLSARRMFTSTTELYRRHFAERFYGTRTIVELPKPPARPRLLLNVTNLYAPPERAREFITNDWADQRLDDTLIADAVAASAAFPGVFGPVELRWMAQLTSGYSIGTHFLADGGVIENLGTEGLRRYLKRLSWTEWYRERPSILIVSDASAYPTEPAILKANPAADETLLRSDSLQFYHLHRLIFAELTGRDDLWSDIPRRPVWTQYRRAAYPRRFVPDDLPPAGSVHRVYREAGPPEERLEAPELYTINIATTHENTEEMLKSQAFQACVGPSGATAAELQRQVRGFRTLNELNTGDARNAFWMGYVLGQAYGQAVVCAKEELSGGKCTAAPPAPALTCRP